ncbi:MAG TPA: hypothetical protein VHC86_04725 [Opitutaceae bacterium]|nr:hypothetical protein [Opitutaceae bacterium]
MVLDTTASTQASNPRFLWNEIVRWTFEACILRKEGKEDKVAFLLQERLPSLIRSWSARSGLKPDACREQLRSLFNRVQESVELGFIQRRLIVDEVCARLAGRLPGSGVSKPAPAASVGLRRRVPFDNVPDMLDALAEAEFEAEGERILPVRSALAPTARIFAGEPVPQVALSA